MLVQSYTQNYGFCISLHPQYLNIYTHSIIQKENHPDTQ